MRQNRVVLRIRVSPLHPHRTSDADSQVGNLFHSMALIDSCEFCRSIYAVTLRNILIAIGFAVITVSQFAFGTYSLVLATREGGKDNPLDQKHYSHSGGPRVPS